MHDVIEKWFECWNKGTIESLPISNDFSHTSPFGTINSKARYMEVVDKNKQDFLGNKLKVIKHIQQGNEVCVQFEQHNVNTGLRMTVCEWYVIEKSMIKEIRSFYNVGNAVLNG